MSFGRHTHWLSEQMTTQMTAAEQYSKIGNRTGEGKKNCSIWDLTRTPHKNPFREING